MALCAEAEPATRRKAAITPIARPSFREGGNMMDSSLAEIGVSRPRLVSLRPIGG
jgi:hypothetical protein